MGPKGLTHSFLAVEVRNSHWGGGSEEEFCLLVPQAEMEDSR